MLELFLDERDALGRGDITLKGDAALNRLDGVEIDADFDGSLWHVL